MCMPTSGPPSTAMTGPSALASSAAGDAAVNACRFSCSALPLKLAAPQFAALANQTLKPIWKYVVPYRGRFALRLLPGTLSAAFHGFIIISFQLISSLVLKGKTCTLGEPTDLPLIGEIDLSKMLGADADARSSYERSSVQWRHAFSSIATTILGSLRGVADRHSLIQAPDVCVHGTPCRQTHL